MGDISIQWLGAGDECIITRTTYRHKHFVGKKYPVVQRYRGSATVWHDADTGERVGYPLESTLYDVWTKAKWERNDE